MIIAAVIVTFNRLELLKKCIDAVRNQTRKVDEIIVVNNGSTDGTKEWLEKQKDLTIINQENLGGAGGFYTGIKTAYESGFDWVWCMDDDCLPKESCLELQLPESVYTITGPRVIDGKTDVWNCNYNKLKYRLLNLLRIPFITIPFNGFLISNYTIKKIGLPIREFFIYSDDVEYSFRAYKMGIKLDIKNLAYMEHPKPKGIKNMKENMLFYYLRNNFLSSMLYDFFYFRTILRLIRFIISKDIFNKKLIFICLYDAFRMKREIKLKYKLN